MRTNTFKKTFLSTAFISMLYLFLYIPIIILIIFSFNKGTFPAPWSKFTFAWYKELWFNSSEIWQAFYNSIIIAFSTTFLSLFMGIILIYYLMHNPKVKNWINIFYANLIIPEIVLAVGLLSLFTFLSIPLGKVTLIIAHTTLGIGYAIPILQISFEEMDKRMIEASLDLGATRAQTFFKIILPLLKPAILVSGLLVFIISFDDFVLSYFCSGITAQTLPIHILSMLRTEISPVINALSTGMVLLSSILVLISFSLLIRKKFFLK